MWRQFNGEYGTTVALAPDGLRLRSGLVQTTAETIRPGRVQAVRLVEPLVWRWFGWSRLEVDVAGARQRRENQSEARRLRALVPVGSRAEAENMLGELVARAPQPTRRPPGGTRWKAPLTYHFLAWGGDDRYVVASRGRIRRTTTWVPLEKVQSVRWVQGPWQRRLGLASVKLDVAGKRVTARITDRSEAEARDILARLPAQARAARLRASAGRPTAPGSAPSGPSPAPYRWPAPLPGEPPATRPPLNQPHPPQPTQYLRTDAGFRFSGKASQVLHILTSAGWGIFRILPAGSGISRSLAGPGRGDFPRQMSEGATWQSERPSHDRGSTTRRPGRF